MRALACAAALLLVSCFRGTWHSPRADMPATRAELAVYRLTVESCPPGPTHDGCETVRAALAQALAQLGFFVVDHAPYHNDLALELRLLGREDAPGATIVAATLRSDGFFVDEQEATAPPGDLRDAAALQELVNALADRIATSQAVADFIRNSGLPIQKPTMN